jgi:hypothetical protein
MNPSIFFRMMLGIAVWLAPAAVHAQASLARKAAAELMEVFGEAGARQSAREATEMGGERAVREVLEKAAVQGGDDLVRQVVHLGKAQGPRALRAVQGDPALMTRALTGLPEGRMAAAVGEASRQPALMAKLVRTHGDEALAAAARHPGVGAKVIDDFGAGGLKAARELGTDEVLVLAKTRGFRELPAAARQKFAGLLDRNPRAVSKFLKLAAGGTAIVLTVGFVNQLEAELFGEGGRLVAPLITYGWIAGGILVAALAVFLGRMVLPGGSRRQGSHHDPMAVEKARTASHKTRLRSHRRTTTQFRG